MVRKVVGEGYSLPVAFHLVTVATTIHPAFLTVAMFCHSLAAFPALRKNYPLFCLPGSCFYCWHRCFKTYPVSDWRVLFGTALVKLIPVLLWADICFFVIVKFEPHQIVIQIRQDRFSVKKAADCAYKYRVIAYTTYDVRTCPSKS